MQSYRITIQPTINVTDAAKTTANGSRVTSDLEIVDDYKSANDCRIVERNDPITTASLLTTNGTVVATTINDPRKMGINDTRATRPIQSTDGSVVATTNGTVVATTKSRLMICE